LKGLFVYIFVSYIVAKGKMLLIKSDSGVDNSFFQQTCKHVADKLSTILQKGAGALSTHAFPLPKKGAFYGPAG
jgi:hypothetical protein